MAKEPVRAVKIFYCYAREDRALRDELERHMGALKRSGRVTTWYDREIQPGAEWAREIEARLDTADIILLLVSPDFISSDYCYGVEMTRALERRAAGEALVVPVHVRPVYWKGTPVDELQRLPADGKPVTTWDDRDEAFEDVTRGISNLVEGLQARWAEEERMRRAQEEETTQKMEEKRARTLARTLAWHDEQIIYLSPEEELTTVRERLERSLAQRIILIIPPQTQLRSKVGWRLLHARARELGKDVLVISSDRYIRAVVKAAGFRVAESQESPPSGGTRPGSRPGRTGAGGRTGTRLRGSPGRYTPDDKGSSIDIRIRQREQPAPRDFIPSDRGTIPQEPQSYVHDTTAGAVYDFRINASPPPSGAEAGQDFDEQASLVEDYKVAQSIRQEMLQKYDLEDLEEALSPISNQTARPFAPQPPIQPRSRTPIRGTPANSITPGMSRPETPRARRAREADEPKRKPKRFYTKLILGAGVLGILIVTLLSSIDIGTKVAFIILEILSFIYLLTR